MKMRRQPRCNIGRPDKVDQRYFRGRIDAHHLFEMPFT